VGKQSNAINFNYLSFLRTMMSRPLLVTLGGGVRRTSSLTIPLAPAVRSSIRFLLGASFFKIVMLPL
jgi:hypothetical protein